MVDRSPLLPKRARRIAGSFAFIEHRFLQDGFLESLTHHELLLYFFLILAADRNGISFYSYDRICKTLRLGVDDYILARNALLDKDLLAFDGNRFQVLSLPEKPVWTTTRLLKTRQDMIERDPATIHQNLCEALGVDPDEQLRASRK
jgi:hypothetical protein